MNPSSAAEALSETSGVSETDHPAIDPAKTHINFISIMRLLQLAFLINREQGKKTGTVVHAADPFHPVRGFQALGDALKRRHFGNRSFDLLRRYGRVGPSDRLLFAVGVFASHDVDDPAVALYKEKADDALDELQRAANDIERQNRKRRKPT